MLGAYEPSVSLNFHPSSIRGFSIALRNIYNFTVQTFAIDNPNKVAYASVTVKVGRVGGETGGKNMGD